MADRNERQPTQGGDRDKLTRFQDSELAQHLRQALTFALSTTGQDEREVTMSGAGFQGAGTTSAGFGAPSRGAEEGGVILRDEATGASLTGRRLDPRTGDYVVDENGRLLGMPTVQQLVQLAVMNSAAALQQIDRLNDGFERAATAVLTTACGPIVQQGLIAVIGVRNVRLGVRGGLAQGQAVYQFLWRDLTTNTEQGTPI